MKSKKTMLILPVVAVALCAVALIGTGFALQYEGKTSNSGNDVDYEYIKLSLGNNVDDYEKGAFTNKLYYDSLTVVENVNQVDTPVTKYKVKNSYELHDGKKLVSLGSETILVTNTNDDARYTFKITNTPQISGELYVKINTDSIEPYTSGEENTFDLAGTVSSITVELYIDLTNAIDNYVYYEEGVPSSPITDAVTFTFTATVNTELNVV